MSEIPGTAGYKVSDDVLALNPELKAMVGDRAPVRKYHNQPAMVDGIRFDSGKEAARANELLMMLRAGEIIALVFHKRLPVHPEGSKPIYMEPDFIYVDKELDIHVEDTKAEITKTRAYRIKKKLFEGKYKVKIVEV